MGAILAVLWLVTAVLHTSEWPMWARTTAQIIAVSAVLSPFFILRKWVRAGEEPPAD